MNSFDIPYHIENRYADKGKANILIDKGVQEYEVLNEIGELQLCKTQFQGHFYYAVCKNRKEQLYATGSIDDAKKFMDWLNEPSK